MGPAHQAGQLARSQGIRIQPEGIKGIHTGALGDKALLEVSFGGPAISCDGSFSKMVVFKKKRIFKELRFMLEPGFEEPSNEELRLFYPIFDKTVGGFIEGGSDDGAALGVAERDSLRALVRGHPYLPEPHLALARSLRAEGKVDEAEDEAKAAVTQFELLGHPWYKAPNSGNVFKEVLEAALKEAGPISRL